MSNENLVNDNRLADGVKIIRELGRDAALGKDSLPKLAFQVTKMAQDGVIDLEKKWQDPVDASKMFDDAEYLFGEYAKAEGKKAIHERTAGGLKANVSKLRQLITFGVMTTIDPSSVLERAVKVRSEMIDQGEKVKAAYASYVDVARVQIANSDDELTDEQLTAAIRKPAAKDPEVEKILRGVYKKLENLISGEKGVKDDSELVEQAFNAVRDRLSEIDQVNKAEDAENTLATLTPAARSALLAKLGYVGS